jgi:hypothetical protein
MTTQCADVARVLEEVFHLYSTGLLPPEKLPIDVNENVTANLKQGGSKISLEDDSVVAPPSILACDAAVTQAAARVRAGTPAVFKLAHSCAAQQHECVLTALASGADVFAILRSVDNLHVGVIDVLVAVDIKVDIEHNCVLIVVSVPPGTPDGALVVIKNVWVAGCAVFLNELSSTITIGFNHAPAPKGAVWTAAYYNDLPGLNAALRNGESTEEKDAVSSLSGGVVGMLILTPIAYYNGSIVSKCMLYSDIAHPFACFSPPLSPDSFVSPHSPVHGRL